MFLSGFLLIKKDLMLKCLNKVICFVKNFAACSTQSGIICTSNVKLRIWFTYIQEYINLTVESSFAWEVENRCETEQSLISLCTAKYIRVKGMSIPSSS